MKPMKRFEVSVRETSRGYVIVDAEDRDGATKIAIQKCQRGVAVMADDSDIETLDVKEVMPMGFGTNRN